MKALVPFVVSFVLLPTSLIPENSLQAGRRAITFDDFIALNNVSDPRVSPDGRWVAFVVTDYSLQENRGNSDIWVGPVGGGKASRLTQSPTIDSQPRWSQDSQRLAFVSARDGAPQIYLISISGGEARRISDLKTGLSNLTWSPDGLWMAFSSDLKWPKGNPDEETYPTQVKIWDELYYRHWNEWRVGKRSHLLVIPFKNGHKRVGVARDLTPIDRDVPTLALGGFQDIAFTPDSQFIAFTMNSKKVPATGTNNDIFLVPVKGGSLANLTEGNPANDNNPLFSPDGGWMAYRAQIRAGFESDRYRLMLYDRHDKRIDDLTPDWKLSVGEITLAPDSGSIYSFVEEKAQNALYRFSVPVRSRKKLTKEGHIRSIRMAPDGSALVFTRQTANQPSEIYAFDLKTAKVRPLSHINDQRVAGLEMNPIEEFWYTGALGERVQGLLLKPPFFDPSQKYPLVYLIHGGPQGAWQDSFHPRWNYQMFAAPGYVVAMVNFHGSTGYGQDFTDSISQHWGDYPYQDVMKGLDYLLVNYPFIDSSKVAAAGASYGGYMINWIAGHTDRFVCLVNHDGVFNLPSMYDVW